MNAISDTAAPTGRKILAQGKERSDAALGHQAQNPPSPVGAEERPQMFQTLSEKSIESIRATPSLESGESSIARTLSAKSLDAIRSTPSGISETSSRKFQTPSGITSDEKLSTLSTESPALEKRARLLAAELEITRKQLESRT
jgi:hypothetical protein